MVLTGVSRTILLLEDDPAVSNLMCCILHNAGYTVLAASSGADAVNLACSQQGGIDLLLCDVVLRDEKAAAIVPRLRELCPGVRALFLSGFTLEDLFQRDLLAPDMVDRDSAFFLQKPFTPGDLTRTVRAILAGGQIAAAAF